MKPLPTTLAVLALSTIAFAQTVAVFPTSAAANGGESEESRFPWGYGVSRTMGVYDNWDLNVPNGATITAVGFRQELGRTSTARGVQLEVYMGPAATTSRTASTTFDSNYVSGVTPIQVFGPGIVNLPAGDPNATTPLDIMIPLSTPYTYNSAQGLVVEFRVLANSNANQSFSYYVDRQTFYSPVTSFGQGCTTSAGQVPMLALQPTYIGGDLVANITRAPASSFVYLNLNTVTTPPLNGAAFGAPGCTLYVPPVLVETLQAGSTSGTAQFRIPVPYDLALYQLDIYGQGLIADLFANNLGFVSTNANHMVIGAEGPMATIAASGNSAGSVGGVSRSRGVVTLFRYQ